MSVPIRPLGLLLALACASPGAGGSRPEAPTFTRLRPYAPEDLNRDVVECADDTRVRLAALESSAARSGEELRADLHEATDACMRQRGWRRG